MTYKRRTDSTHAPIRDHLRDRASELGLQAVIDTHGLGDGFPDIVVVLVNGTLVLFFEVKGERIRPTDLVAEVKFMLKLVSPAYRIVKTPENAVLAIIELADLKHFMQEFSRMEDIHRYDSLPDA